MKFSLLLLLWLLIGCAQDNPEPTTVNAEYITLNCLYQEDTQFIIETEEAFIQMATQIYNDRIGFDCIDTTKAPFSFDEYVLCGRCTWIDQNDQINTSVYLDDPKKKLIYKIEVNIVPGPDENGGFGKIYSSGMNWVKIPKPPDDYVVVIDYTEY